MMSIQHSDSGNTDSENHLFNHGILEFIKFKHFQKPSDTDSKTFTNHVCFQEFSRPRKSQKKIQRLSRTCKSPDIT